MKRFFVGLLIVLLVLVTGCNGDSGTSGSNNGDHMLEGIIFEDVNGNGIFDSNENGIANLGVFAGDIVLQTDNHGRYELETTEATVVIEVDEDSLDDGYVLTTDNYKQTIEFTGDSTQAEPIGYYKAEITHVEEEPLFSELFTSTQGLTNYSFELYMKNNQMEMPSIKIWVDGTNFRSEDDMMAMFYLPDQGILGMYNKAANQVMVSPITEAIPITTPFTLIDEIDDSTFDLIHYKGIETFEDKEVAVYENTTVGFGARYYVWKEYGIIVKMEVLVDGYEAIYEFRNLKIGSVSTSDFEYPEDADVVDMSNLGN